MLVWNIKNMLAVKGIAQPFAWLRKQGIAHDQAHRLNTGQQQRLDIVAINKICTAAWCTPNDLFVYEPDGKTIIDPAHPLNKLKAKAISKLNDKLKKMSPEQIAELDKFAEGLGTE